jgi:hypothetical protein
MNTKKSGSDRVINREVLIANYDVKTNDILYPNGGRLAVQKPLLELKEAQTYTELEG